MYMNVLREDLHSWERIGDKFDRYVEISKHSRENKNVMQERKVTIMYNKAQLYQLYNHVMHTVKINLTKTTIYLKSRELIIGLILIFHSGKSIR